MKGAGRGEAKMLQNASQLLYFYSNRAIHSVLVSLHQTGTVTQNLFAHGNKSEHETVYS